ncbi:MAG: hypothetical protein K2X11_10755 [Acetobacteraceae bacterium]|nr:hypothetical protein [Acetobacteraceae bacterium]
MRRRDFALLVAPLAAACAPTAEQQAAALSPVAAAVDLRARQSRRFDTSDQALMMQSVVAALQDLGFQIDESRPQHGIVVASRVQGWRTRAQSVLLPSADRRALVLRVTFQRMMARPGAMLALGETLDDPELYQGFFERVAQSAFLTAHEI